MPNKLELLVKKLSPYHTFSSLTSSFLLLPKNSLLPLGDRGSFQQREEKKKKKKKVTRQNATCPKIEKNK